MTALVLSPKSHSHSDVGPESRFDVSSNETNVFSAVIFGWDILYTQFAALVTVSVTGPAGLLKKV